MMSMVKSFSLLPLFCLALLSGCSFNPTTAPYAGENEGLVVFGTDIVVRGDAELEYNYIFTVENLASGETSRLRLVVREGETYAVLGRLQPGDYAFVKREDIRRDARGIRLEEIDGRFSVAAGEVTLPKHLRVEKGLYTRKVEITDLSDGEARVLFDVQLYDQSAFAGWRVHSSE